MLLRARVQASTKHPRRLLLVCLTGMFATSFPITILTISIKPIADELHSVQTLAAAPAALALLVRLERRAASLVHPLTEHQLRAAVT
jgi:hypothetical protein